MKITKIFRDQKGSLVTEFKAFKEDIPEISKIMGFNKRQEAQLREYLEQKKDVLYVKGFHDQVSVDGGTYTSNTFPALTESEVNDKEENKSENIQDSTNVAEKEETKKANTKKGSSRK